VALNIKNGIKLFLPPVFIKVGKLLLLPLREPSKCVLSAIFLDGDYESWEQALEDSDGYSSIAILEKTKDALLKVKSGDVAYERDSVIFDEVQYSWPLLAGLMWSAVMHHGHLNVLDFGGSLGSTFFQNREFCKYCQSVRWNIVEQPNVARVGKASFEDDKLKFFSSINKCVGESVPDVAICCGVLQYVKEPFAVLEELFELGVDVLIIDRTPFWRGQCDKLCVQHVPSSIYEASYPSWIFSYSRFLQLLAEDWNVVAQFDALDILPNDVDAFWKGFIMTRKAMSES